MQSSIFTTKLNGKNDPELMSLPRINWTSLAFSEERYFATLGSVTRNKQPSEVAQITEENVRIEKLYF